MAKTIYSPPILGVITGIPGSGKSSLSTGLQLPDGRVDGVLDRVVAAYLDKDRIADAFMPERGGPSYPAVRELTYRIIDNLVASNLGAGTSVWVEATFSTTVTDPRWADRFHALAGDRLRILRCVAPADVIFERLRKRGYARDQGKLADWERYLQGEPIHVPLSYGGIDIDTTRPQAESLRQALDFLSA